MATTVIAPDTFAATPHDGRPAHKYPISESAEVEKPKRKSDSARLRIKALPFRNLTALVVIPIHSSKPLPKVEKTPQIVNMGPNHSKVGP